MRTGRAGYLSQCRNCYPTSDKRAAAGDPISMPVGASSVVITERLDRRPPRASDFAAENRALETLACAMAAQPAAVLRKIVGAVIELCRADSAGISIMEPRGDTEVFCWRAVAGTLGAYVDTVMPYHASPCAMVLTSDTVLLFDRITEQQFPAVKDIEPPIFETLLAPFHRDGKPIGTVWAVSHDPDRKFDAEDARLLRSLAHFASAAHQMAAALDAAQAGRRELEWQVNERTRALHNANLALQREAAERARAEEALRQSLKMEAVDQLTGGIAHDFNNMLQSIGGSLEMLQRRVEQDRLPEAARYIETARTGVERAAALTHRLLAFSRRQMLQPRPVTLGTCIASIAEPIRRAVGPDIAVEFSLCGQTCPVLCDPDQLESALLNLAVNARDAMPGGGTLTVATADRILTSAELLGQEGAKPGAYVEISVTDSGTGMTGHVASRAFDPFFTTKPVGQGTGLGLSQIYGFARQSGGLARLESVPGQGTTVRLLLPCHVTDRKISALRQLEARTGHDTTVLVVEDEEDVRALVADALREQGHTVLEAADGQAGVRVLQSDARVDVLVTDVGLPGMDGRQLADAARVGRPNLPVLLITGYAEAALDAHLAPGMEVIHKPFALDVLAEKTRGMVEAARAAAAEDGLAAIG